MVDQVLGAASSAQTWSHHCNACGKCCNSPPQMSLPELFHHQERFIGALGVRRVQRPPQGDETLAERVLYAASGKNYLALLTHAIDYNTSNRCPALTPTGLCAIHDDRKPRACAVVPLDALLPDVQQHVVLAARASGGAEYIGADCIMPGERSDLRPHTRQGMVTDPMARKALVAHRDELAADKRFWGRSVFAELQRDLLSQHDGLAHIPQTGMRALPLAPAILVISQISNRCRLRCIEYMQAQLALTDRSIELALQRRYATERAFTAQLRSFADVARRLLPRLQAQNTRGRAAHASEVEAWLGLRSDS